MLSTIISAAPCACTLGASSALVTPTLLLSREDFLARFPDLALVAVFPDYDSEDSRGVSYYTQEFDEPGAIYDEIVGYRYSPAEFAQSLQGIKSALRYAVDATAVLTRPEWQERRVEAQRRDLEEEAQAIARKHGVKFGTFDFLDALEREEQEAVSFRESLREDGLCIGYGVSYAQWQQEDEWAQDQRSAASRIRDFLCEHCPLLMARWEERCLAQVQEERTT